MTPYLFGLSNIGIQNMNMNILRCYNLQ